MSSYRVNYDQAKQHLTILQMSGIAKKGEISKFVRKTLQPIVSSGRSEFVRRTKNGDPRRMRLAIRAMIFKQTIGGKVTMERPGYREKVETKQAIRQKTGKKTRNRAKSAETLRQERYYGKSRQFIMYMHQTGRNSRRPAHHLKGLFDATAQRVRAAGPQLGNFVASEIEKTSEQFK